MKMKLPGFLMSVVAAAAILLPSCSRDDWQEGDSWYDEWATCYYFGNGLGDTSTFMLDVRQGYTEDGESLVSGREMHLVLSAPPVGDSMLPSGEYAVSADTGRPYVVKTGLANLADGSYIALRNNPRQKWTRYPVESGKVRIDRHGDGYGIRLRVVAGGGYCEYGYEGAVLAVDMAN